MSSLALFAQCRGGKIDEPAGSVVTVNIGKMADESPEGFACDVELVALETSDDVLVGVVKSLYVSETSIYMFDVNSNFFVFDRSGRFRFRSPPRGRGPGEFLSISAFAVDTRSGDIFICDNIQSKILIFDEHGDCRKELRNVDNALAGAVDAVFADDGNLLANLYFSPEFSHCYAVFDRKRDYKLDKYILKYPYRWKSRSLDGAKPKIAKNRDGVYLTSILSDTIYRLNPCGDVAPAYVIGSGLGSVYLAGYSDVDDYFDLTLRVTRNKGLTRGVRNILMTDRIGYTGLYYHNGCVNHVFWNLSTGNGCIFPQKGGNDDILADMDLVAATGDAFVGIVYPDRISERQLLTDPRFAALKSIGPDDNPVIVFCDVRESDGLF